jgi:hypothetical protein
MIDEDKMVSTKELETAISINSPSSTDSKCPQLEEIAELIDGVTSPDRRDCLLKHISVCPICYEVFIQSRHLSGHRTGRKISLFKLLPIAASLIVGVLSVYLVVNLDKNSPVPPPATLHYSVQDSREMIRKVPKESDKNTDHFVSPENLFKARENILNKPAAPMVDAAKVSPGKNKAMKEERVLGTMEEEVVSVETEFNIILGSRLKPGTIMIDGENNAAGQTRASRKQSPINAKSELYSLAVSLDIRSFLKKAKKGSVFERYLVLMQSGWFYQKNSYYDSDFIPIWLNKSLSRAEKNETLKTIINEWEGLRRDLRYELEKDISYYTVKNLKKLIAED